MRGGKGNLYNVGIACQYLERLTVTGKKGTLLLLLLLFIIIIFRICSFSSERCWELRFIV